MVPSELTRRVGMGELLVLLVCSKLGPYGVPDQQGDTTLFDHKKTAPSKHWLPKHPYLNKYFILVLV